MSLALNALLLVGAGWGAYKLVTSVTGSVKEEAREAERARINERVAEADRRDNDPLRPGSTADRKDQARMREELQDRAREREVAKAKEAAAKKVAPPAKPSEYGTHTVSKGETLSGIAQRYRTSPFWLKSLNGLKSDTILVGQILKVPRLTRRDEQGRTIPQGDEFWGGR